MKDYRTELSEERAFTAKVQQVLSAVIMSLGERAALKKETIHTILADAWDELRMKPTALSPQELEQLAIEVDRFTAQRSLVLSRAEAYEKMLKEPFFARIDFRESDADPAEAPERIVIGLYSLRSPEGEFLVHDWRAPICGLYYDALPGPAGFVSPSGPITGELTLKRQYRLKDGKLEYFVDTDNSVNDSMLLDMLGGESSPRMKQIVASIQAEQNRIIRCREAKVMSVTGGAGSGKTSVAMHRAAYLLYHNRGRLDSSAICVLSPTDSFIEYISTVLPDLGEENTRAMTLTRICEKTLGKRVEPPLKQYEALLSPEGALRRRSVAWKADQRVIDAVDRLIGRVRDAGPGFADVSMDGKTLFTRQTLERMYREELKVLTPAQRLDHIRLILEKRLEDMNGKLYASYEEQLSEHYSGRELVFMTRLAVAQRLRPVKAQLSEMLTIDPARLYAGALRAAGAPEELCAAAEENAAFGVVWYEDAPSLARVALALGRSRPDTTIRTLLVDEAQDYTDAALRLVRAYFPAASVTLLGDPNQRTTPALPECRPERWGAQFGEPDAPCLRLTRGYRSTLEIAAVCRSFLPDGAAPDEPIGRHGPEPTREPFDQKALESRLQAWLSGGMKRVAVITADQRAALRVSQRIRGSFLLTGEQNELEDHGVTVGSISLFKGLEFDAVAVVWDMTGAQDAAERRRLYTVCSRALHDLAIFELKPGESV